VNLRFRHRHQPARNDARGAIGLLALALFVAICFSHSTSSFAQAPPAPSQAPRPQISLPSSSNTATDSASPDSAHYNNGIPNGVSAPTGYQLSPNDSIAVEVFGEDDLKTSTRLNGEGAVSLPLLGSVRLSGLTLSQATAKITELYARDYLVNPKVNIVLLGYAKRRFTVLGQVSRPGSYEMPETSPGGIDLLEAIAMAGGYTRIAAPERVSVRRHPGESGEKVIRVDAKRLARGGGGTFRVESGDTITVGESIF
jgi:protein involved in polysaccharide export with SLBB domain